MEAKIFTVVEANAVLDQVVKPAMDRIMERIAALEALRTEIEVARLMVETGASETNPDRTQLTGLEDRRRGVNAEIREEAEAIHATGGVIKDVRTGLVDFFTVMDGKLVFLCWKRGEERIRYWHTVEEGFRGRRPITARLRRED